jgi:hypothetical protein
LFAQHAGGFMGVLEGVNIYLYTDRLNPFKYL